MAPIESRVGRDHGDGPRRTLVTAASTRRRYAAAPARGARRGPVAGRPTASTVMRRLRGVLLASELLPGGGRSWQATRRESGRRRGAAQGRRGHSGDVTARGSRLDFRVFG